jgi:hypothetical protein
MACKRNIVSGWSRRSYPALALADPAASAPSHIGRYQKQQISFPKYRKGIAIAGRGSGGMVAGRVAEALTNGAKIVPSRDRYLIDGS